MVIHQGNRGNLTVSLQSINSSGGVHMLLSHTKNEKLQNHRTSKPCSCATNCNNCPWVDFRDYELCGQTHCPAVENTTY